MSHRIRREVQQLTNVEERKWPATIIRREPAICIEVKFLFDLAGRTMKPAQILRGLLEDSGRQILLIRPGCVIFDSVHVVFGSHLFLKFSKIGISEIFRFLVFRRIETEQENDQNEDDRDCAHGLFTCRKSLRQRWRVARPATDSMRRTRRKRPSLSLGRLDLSSYYVSQAFEDRHFT